MRRWVGRRPPRHVTAPCYWLLRSVMLELGVLLPWEGLFAPRERWAQLVQREGALWLRVDRPVCGDVALVRLRPYHMGVLVCGGKLLHCPSWETGVVLQDVSRYEAVLVGFYRYAGPAGT